MLRTAGYLIALLFLSNCARTVSTKYNTVIGLCSGANSKLLIQNYLLQFDGEENKTYFEASLRVRHGLGTSIQVNAPCSISTTTATLKERILGYAHYVARTAGETASAPFAFTDAAGTVFNNTVTLKTIALSSPPASISKLTSSFEFSFTPEIDFSFVSEAPASENVILELVDSKHVPMAYRTVSAYRKSSSDKSSKFVVTNNTNPDADDNISKSFPVGQPLFIRAIREVRTEIINDGSTGSKGFLVSRYYTAYTSVTVTD